MPLSNFTQKDVNQIRAGFALAREIREFAEEFEKKRFLTTSEFVEAARLVTRLENYLEEIKENPVLDHACEALRPYAKKVKPLIMQ